MTHNIIKGLRDRYPAVFFVPALLGLAFFILYACLQTTSVTGGDTGEMVSAAYTYGIAHPPGYPLFMLLGAALTHLLKFGTVAWRMGFLSSLPMAVSVSLVWLIVYRLTKHQFAPLFSSAFYGLLYPVWLYGIVPEVFGLYAMFSALFVLLFLRWTERPDARGLYILAFISGLALTHQQLTVIPLIAAAFTVFLHEKKTVPMFRIHYRRILLFFLLGLVPYLYAPVASLFRPPFDREHASTILGFIQLVSRSSYGAFRASVFTGGILNGLLDLSTFGQYLISDIKLVGLTLALAGLYGLFIQNRRLFTFFTSYLALLIFYLFYAGFPVVSNFSIGTLERFFIVPYQVLVILAGVGLAFFIERSSAVFATRLVPIIICALVILLPVGAFTAHFKNLSALKEDRTIERYTDDILASIPQGAVFGVYNDTTAGGFDYSYYVLGKRPDIIFLNFYLLNRQYYREQLHARYPNLVLPDWKLHTAINGYITEFLSANFRKNIPLTSEIILPNISGYFIPSGLVYVYYPEIESVPDRALILDKNERLWNRFSDPLRGALGTFKHLFLSDVLRLFADHRIALAQAYALSGKYPDAERHADAALAMETNVRVEQYSPYIDLMLERKQCAGARSMTDKLFEKWKNDFVIFEDYHKLFTSCYPGDTTIKEMEKRYQELKPVYDTAAQ